MSKNKYKLSVIIKAFNEEEKIAACIESVLKEVGDIDAEVILVDSLSTDKTVEIAKRYPIRIVQLKNPEEVCIGAATQLGYQVSSGEYIYLIDGDMECVPGFLAEAFKYLSGNLRVAGVAGKLVDRQILTESDKRRANTYAAITEVKLEASLGGGGLYRRTAIDEVSYFSHSGLKACEEAELGVRLRSKGWLLARLPLDAVFHTGHTESNWQNVWRLLCNGRLAANGVFIRSAIFKPWILLVVRSQWYLFVVFISCCLSVLSGIFLGDTWSEVACYSSILYLLICSVLFVLLAYKKRSLGSGVYGLAVWNIAFVCAAFGFFRCMRTCQKTLKYKQLS